MKYKVLVTARSFGISDSLAEELLNDHDCEVIKLDGKNGPISLQLEKELPTADAVIAGLEKYDEVLISSANKLKIISRYGVGYENVDVGSATKNGIAVTITPNANSESVADMAVALMLECARNISTMNTSIKDGKQIRPYGVEMWEKTVGIIGMGNIGRGVAKRCSGFNMRILCFDKYKDKSIDKELNVEYTDFDTLIEQSDFITLHTPLTNETLNMFSHPQFSKMKKDAILINTARGGLVNEKDLYEALLEGTIRGAGLDSTVEEPPYGNPLLSLDNCVITPHAGAATLEASSKMSYLAAQNVISILEDNHCDYQVK